MTAYYNEIDPYAAQWLRNLIAAGHIAPGDVDERSIEDVRPDDLRGYTQCHFFAGIGVWSHALRRAAWDDSRPVWTGSCPCQPFSAAGKGSGFSDERHLWPAWHYLIEQCRPAVVFGEQVASLDGLGWLDLVQADLEGTGYACGPVDLCAAGVGAPHIRQRLWFVAHTSDQGLEKRIGIGGILGGETGAAQGEATVGSGIRLVSGMADTNAAKRRANAPTGNDRIGQDAGRQEGASNAEGHSESCRLADTNGRDSGAEREQCSREQRQQSKDGGARGMADAELQPGCAEHERKPRGWAEKGPGHITEPRSHGEERGPGPTNGFWRDVDWLGCTDGKWRPVMPGSFPLAHGAPSRVGRLRAYGNAICAEAATTVIAAYLSAACEVAEDAREAA